MLFKVEGSYSIFRYFVFRYGPRNSGPPNYPPMATKVIPSLMPLGIPTDPVPGYRGRYDGPSPFEDIPPGVEPPVPGFEPPPFEKPPFGPPGAMERDRLPPPNFRDSYGPRPPYGDAPGGFREMPIPAIPNEIPVHVGEPPRFRENFRPPPSYREGPPPQFREGQSFRDPQGPQGPYRDPNYRGGPPVFRDGPYRNVPFREPGFRDAPPHTGFRDGVPFRPPSTDSRDPREPVPPNYHDPNFRDGYRDDGVPREHGRPGYRPGVRSRGGPRRNVETDRHREREAHDRERYEAREAERLERSRDPEKRGREGRTREYERSREIEKERDHDRISPDKKSRGSPKRSKEGRDKRRSESRGRSRDREGRKEKKDERNRDKSSDERNKDKEKDKKIKERKKKKREKEKDAEKKKKREKKEKKEKENIKKEDNGDKNENKIGQPEQTQPEPEQQDALYNNALPNTEEISIKKEPSPKVEPETKKPLNDLYGDETSEAVDKEILENYIKTENENEPNQDTKAINDKNAPEASSKEEPFDGIELQVNAEELDLKPEPEAVNKEMLAPLPELSKWEVDEENTEKSKEPGEISSPEEEEDGGKVTSDVIKRAENAIFAKAINSLRPIEIKKISSDRLKLYSDENAKASMNNIQITVPVTDHDQRSIEIQEKKKRYSKTPPPRLSVKERLGGKVEDPKRGREPRVVHSTVERVKSRSKTPKKDQPYRRVTVEKERGRKQDPPKAERRVASETVKVHGKRSAREKKESDKHHKDDKRPSENVSSRSHDKNAPSILKSETDRERKKSTLDEAHFEPDYDENVESEAELKDEAIMKKRERSASPMGNESKKAKIENETIKLDLANVKKKPDTETETTSDSDDSSSSSSEGRKRSKKKKKRSKKKKKRAASESDSDSDSSSDDHKKKKKKRKHKKKSSKKKSKKSKHK